MRVRIQRPGRGPVRATVPMRPPHTLVTRLDPLPHVGDPTEFSNTKTGFLDQSPPLTEQPEPLGQRRSSNQKRM
ncbi:MAG: hypothetical protein ACYDDV_08335 [Methanoregula sp.]